MCEGASTYCGEPECIVYHKIYQFHKQVSKIYQFYFTKYIGVTN